jgi:hypothetical protein
MSWFRKPFNVFIEELKEHYREFFEDLDAGLPPVEAKLSGYGILPELNSK